MDLSLKPKVPVSTKMDGNTCMVHVFRTCHTMDPKEERGEEKMKWERKKKKNYFFPLLSIAEEF